jgi:Thiamine pyrophosphate enzyme, N-terminal TPP binding domain
MVAQLRETPAFMACAHAKFTGEVGVCLATSGPGAIHLLNGLYDAKLDHQPVLAIVGQQARAALGGQYQQEIDLVSLFKDVASEFVQMAMVPAQFAIWSTARGALRWRSAPSPLSSFRTICSSLKGSKNRPASMARSTPELAIANRFASRETTISSEAANVLRQQGCNAGRSRGPACR